MRVHSRARAVFFIAALSIALTARPSVAQGSASAIPADHLLGVDQLAASLKAEKDDKPLVLQVGPRVLFQQAHVPGSEFVGAASTDAGLAQLKKRVEKLPKGQFIVLYCGCCPWDHCPNVKPAYDALQSAGFARVKVLYMANNFGADWVERGYPTAKGD